MNMAGQSRLEDNLGMLRKAFNKDKGVNENKLQNKVLKLLLQKADIIQNNPTEETEEMVRDLKQLSKLEWWVCFSNVDQNKKHQQVLEALKDVANVSVFEDFEEFVNTGDDDPKVQKVLVMNKYKRTYKLIVAMNRNILPLDYEWVADVAQHGNVFGNPCDFFLKFPESGKILPGFNKSNVVGWFKRHSHKFRVDLRHSYLMRKQSPFGFLQNHNIIIYDKCFRGIRLENLNINRTGSDAQGGTKLRGERSTRKETDNCYIMRRIVETADGRASIVNALDKVKTVYSESMVNVLVVDNFRHEELERIHGECKFIKIFSKESFLNSFMKQYLHANEQMQFKKKSVAK